MRAAAWAAGLLDLLLPAGCLCCGTWIPGPGTSLVCAPCRTRLPRAPWPRCPRCDHPRGTGREASAAACRVCAPWPRELGHARHAYLLAPPADALVHALKYEGWAELAVTMGRDMAAVPLPPGPVGAPRVVVPVPTTAARVRKRGYNQALLLAQAVAVGLETSLCEGLSRTRGGATQVALHPSQRRANVRGVFVARPEETPRLRGAHVVLVDDVLTTGATAAEAAAELVRAGAEAVTLLTYARALPFHRGLRS